MCGAWNAFYVTLGHAGPVATAPVMGFCSRQRSCSSARSKCPTIPSVPCGWPDFEAQPRIEFIDQRQIHGHAFDILEEASLSCGVTSPSQAGSRKASWNGRRTRFPFLALREAVVNAICHRDYSIPGGAIHIAVYDDRLEIISTGLLPPGITVADLKRDHPSRPRNPLIAEPFYLRSLIETVGPRHAKNRDAGAGTAATRTPSSEKRPARSPCDSQQPATIRRLQCGLI